MPTIAPKDIPAPLIEAMKSGRVILFLGAGASMESKSDDGKRPPSGKQLAKELANKFLGEDLGDIGLMQVAEMASRTSGQNVVFDWIRSLLKTFKPSPAHKLIPEFRWHTIATTNYDTLVEDAYGAMERPAQDLLPFVKDAEPIEKKISDALNPLVYLKLHGCIEHAHDSEIPLVLDPSHYERFQENRKRLFDRLSDYAHEIPFLFIGYELADPHILNLIYRLDRTGSRPEYYVVAPNIHDALRQHWLSKRIVTIDAKFGSFMKALDKAVPDLWRQIKPGTLRPDLPLRKHFRTTSDPSETLMKCLDTDLAHVHPSMPTEKQSAQKFYRGYDQGFGAIASDLDTRRRVSNDLTLQLIGDQDSGGTKFYLLRGAAGTGKTVALKRIAWDIAKDFDAPVLWIRENGRLRHQTACELYDMIGKRIYLVVDRAIERISEIEEVMRVGRAQKIPLSIIATERDATWNVSSNDFDTRWKSHAFTIGQLVKSEIEDLLGRLKIHSALGVLTSLSAEKQVQAFAEADRHLLVALHEVTQGKPFEEIVIDECRSLMPQKAQQLYLDICTLNQFGAPVRAGVINRISAIPFTVYEREFFAPLQGVVLTHKNKYSGDYEYKARHPRVASLVFKQAFPKDAERVHQLERIISCLDEGYNADRDAITELIRARNLIKLLTDVDHGRDIYDRIQALLGDKWYVLHQRAIFELNHQHGSLVNAEAEGQKALELEPKRASILHTLAEISRLRAQREPDGIRKNVYRQQARERLGKIRTDHSGFADGSRCKLRLDEMRDAIKTTDPTDDASAEELAERTRLARMAIDAAILRHPSDPDIIRLRADFFGILQDSKKARIALERAWTLKSKGPSVGLQLARIYRKDGNSTQVLKVLEELLERHSQDPGVNFEMARYLIREETSNNRAAFHLARSYNSSDRNYHARYMHAQFLFFSNEGKQSAEIFDVVNQIAPPDYQPRSDYKISNISKLIGRINGRVMAREESFAFIKLPTYPHNVYTNIAYNSSDQWARASRQANVSCKIGFNRVGPVAISIRVE